MAKIATYQITRNENGIETQEIVYGARAANARFVEFTSGAYARDDQNVTVILEKLTYNPINFRATVELVKVLQINPAVTPAPAPRVPEETLNEQTINAILRTVRFLSPRFRYALVCKFLRTQLRRWQKCEGTYLFGGFQDQLLAAITREFPELMSAAVRSVNDYSPELKAGRGDYEIGNLGTPAHVDYSTFYGAETTKVYGIAVRPGTVYAQALRIAMPEDKFCYAEWVTQTFVAVVPEVLKRWHIARRELMGAGA